MYLPLIWVYHAQSLAKYTCSQGRSIARQGGSSGLAGDQFSLAVSLNAGITIAAAAAASVFVKTDSPEKVEELRRCFEESSALRFTSESSDNAHLTFLDVKVSQESDNKFSTEVYRKSTNLGLCLNGESECPERYKKSAISAYIRRALTHCSTWPSTTKEFENATQILVNNGFSNKDINNTIRKAVDKWYMDSDDDDRPQEKDLIKIFYKNQFHAKYKEDERALRNIIQEQVKPVNINSEINLVIYYKNKKSANLILKNSPTSNSDMLKKHNVVYAYTCPHERCSQQYIGMTAMRLSKRISCHAQEGAIYNHTRSNHNAKIKREEIIRKTSKSSTPTVIQSISGILRCSIF